MLSQPQRGETATSTYDDYRDFDEIRLPFHERVVVGNVADAELTTAAIDHAPPDLTRPADRTPPHLTTPLVVPFEPMRDGVPLVRVSVEGTPLDFVVASTTYSSIQRRRREQLESKAGHHGVARFALTVGGLALPDHVFGTRPPEAASFVGRDVDGSLGYDVLALFVVEIDPIEKTLTFHDRDTYRHPGTGVPITLEFATPWIDATVDVPGKSPASGRFALDTGCACAVMLRAPFVQEHGLLVGLDTLAPNVAPERGMLAPITALRFADQRFEHLDAVFGLPHFGTLDDPESAGIIGMRVLGRYRLVLDYHHRRVWLDPPVSAGTD
jgi:hypothetical protein